MNPGELGPKTTIHALLEAWPFLLDFLAGYSPKFGVLRSAAMRATMGRIATLEKVAGIGEVPLDKLLKDIAERIATQTGAAPAMASAAAAAGPGREKIETLKGIIRSLHGGKDAEAARAEFTRLLGEIQPEEIAAMEQELIRDGMPVEKIHKLCDLHVNVFRDSLETHEEVQAAPGHPLHTYLAENREIMEAADHFAALCHRVAAGTWDSVAPDIHKALARLARVETHYTRKENQLFPYLEKHGFTGPSQVMWGLHDDVRRMLKELRAALAARDAATVEKVGAEAARVIAEMVYKEEKILFPTAQRMLNDDEWRDIRKGDDEIGYALIPPPPPFPSQPGTAPAAPDRGAALLLNTGTLTLQQLDRMLTTMPVEFSFVDENDEVRYYSGHHERIFPRSPAVIGRKVQNCHPQKSVHMVNEILAAFREGRQDVAEFWLNIQDKFLHITYHAVRNENGRYLGTLEVTQDVTRIRQLGGEKRLLDWEKPGQAGAENAG